MTMDERIRQLADQIDRIDAQIYRLREQRATLVAQDEEYGDYCRRHRDRHKGAPMSIGLYYALSKELLDLCDVHARILELEDLLCH
jgi:hypothetical protein